MLGADHLVPIRLQRGDQLLEARAIGPEPVGEYDAWFALLGHCYLLPSSKLADRPRLRLKELVEQCRPLFLEVAFPLKPALQQSFDSLLRFSPRQRGLEGVESVEEMVGGWQRDLIDEMLRRRDGTPVEGSDPPRERVDEGVQFRVWKCSVDVSVSLRSVAVEVARAENDFERAAAANKRRETFGAAPPGCTPTPTSGWPSNVFSRDAKRISQASTNSLLTPRAQPRIFAMLTTGDLVRRTNVSVRIGRPEGPTAVVMLPVLPVKSKWAR